MYIYILILSNYLLKRCVQVCLETQKGSLIPQNPKPKLNLGMHALSTNPNS